MDEFDDIIDLEEDATDLENVVMDADSSIETPQETMPNIPNFRGKKYDKQAEEKLNVNRERSFQRPMLGNNPNSPDAEKLRNIGNKNMMSMFRNNQSNKQNNEEKNTKDRVQEKVAGKAIEHLSKGAVKGEAAEKIGGFALQALKNHQKIYIGIAIGGFAFIILFIVLIISAIDQDGLGKSGSNYVKGESNEEKFESDLDYYGYGNDSSIGDSEHGASGNDSSNVGIYKVHNKMKSLYNDYNKTCGIMANNSPCEVAINPGVILETINYYQSAFESYGSYYDDETTTDESFSVDNLFAHLLTRFQEYKATKETLEMVEDLALAQTEYVEETCEGKTKKYYQISFNKFISYLKYGETSTHPNYSGKPVQITNDVCVGPKNDYITMDEVMEELKESEDNLSGDELKISGSGINVDIVNYALQFVGNPYVWGGTSLTNGADCSGFTQSVMKHFGINIPKWSGHQATFEKSIGTDVSVALPGDIICYDGHVAIYMGNNKIVHASNSKPYPQGGIKVDDLPNRKIVSIIRAWD